MKKQKLLNKQRSRRRFSNRKKLKGSAERPRLSIFRSAKHISVQVIDDSAGKTLVSASTRDKTLSGDIPNGNGGNCEAAAAVGKAIAARALEAGVKLVKFDRGSFRYHGRVAALADAAREGGLSF